MSAEVIEALICPKGMAFGDPAPMPAAGGLYVDATVGGGGHAEAILLSTRCRLIGIDRDSQALAAAAIRLAPFGDRVSLRHGSFLRLAELLDPSERPQGILFDLGFSSLQLDDPKRGFSFSSDGPLDMRMDPSGGRTAADLLAELSEREMADLFRRLGEERWSPRIARAVVRRRGESPFAGTLDLAGVVASAIPKRYWPRRIHPATRVFQALRIAVNRELEHLEEGLPKALDLLPPGARAVVLTFQSLEDRIVKRIFVRRSKEGPFRLLTKRPRVPTENEVARNPRSRSAKLRAIERVA